MKVNNYVIFECHHSCSQKGGLFCHIANLHSSKMICLFRYSGGNWLSGLVFGRDGGWELRVKGNLTARPDNGRINTSPITTILPIVRLQHGCNQTITIPGKNVRGLKGVFEGGGVGNTGIL